MARILFTTFGSYGDLFPYLAVGRALQMKGHAVTIATSAGYRTKVEREGLRFAPVRPDTSMDDRKMLEYVFDARKGSERVMRLVSSVVKESYEDTIAVAAECDVIVTHPITFGAVLAARKLKLRWISSVLAPISFLSAYDPPALPPAPWISRLSVLGPGVMNAIFSAGKAMSRRWVLPVFTLAEELGVELRENPIFEGSHSPALVLAMFSSLLASPQPDWPPQTVVTGFPFHEEEAEQREMHPELERFFASGPPPIVFTLGSSAVGAAGSFYKESLEAVSSLNARALFLTGTHPQGLPDNLPDFVMTCEYAPHAQVFRRAAVTVHQGGVGTTGQAIRAGQPMLVVPFAHDQFDNGERVRRLGIADVLYRSRYKAGAAAEKLRTLLREPSYAEAARKAGETVRNENGTARAAQAIDEFLQGSTE